MKKQVFDFLVRLTSRKFILSVIGFFFFVDMKKKYMIDDWPFVILMVLCILGSSGLKLLKDIKGGKNDR